MPCEAMITAVMRHFAGITDGGRNLMHLVYFFLPECTSQYSCASFVCW